MVFFRFLDNARRWCSLVLISSLLTGCLKFRKSHEETREKGYEGIARAQPFLAAERLLTKFGWEPDRLHSAKSLPYGGTLILNADSSRDQFTAYQAMDWMERRSGHLILFLSSAESWRDDWAVDFFSYFKDIDSLENHPILQKYHLKPSNNSLRIFGGGKPQEAKIDGAKFMMENTGSITLDATAVAQDTDALAGTAASASLLSFPLSGGGRLTVICDARPFRNRFLDHEAHADVLLALLALRGETGDHTVGMMLSNGLSFYTMFWEKYWMALIALGVLVLLWLWKNFHRFGPLLLPSTTNDRQFADHLRMTGHFLWSYRRSGELLGAMRQSIQRKLQAASHQEMSEGAPARLLEHLSNLSKLPPERVTAAWHTPATSDLRQFIHLMRDLQTIHQSL